MQRMDYDKFGQRRYVLHGNNTVSRITGLANRAINTSPSQIITGTELFWDA
ncbi:MAG: hypothetical protein R6W86_17620 [Marinobacter sp.]|uniref:hypothetical protein n=1 Tax=Marinobacter sp. TaxID=50741 RepID=UPI00396D39B5